MSRKSLTPINALSSATAPSVPTLQSGDLYYNTTTGLMVYDGTAWVTVTAYQNDQSILSMRVFS